MNINAVVMITSTFANVRARNRNQTCLLPLRHCLAHELASDISSCGAVFSSGMDSLRCCDWWPTCGFNGRAFEQFGLAQLQSFQSNPATRLDDVLVESWQPRPSKFLAETEPGTSTNLLLRAEAIVGDRR